MISPLRRLSPVLALALLAACSGGGLSSLKPHPSAAPAKVSAASYASREPGVGQWPQAVSDIPADPDILFGALPNGMKYAIQHSVTPKGQVSMRLRIGTGSIDETDDQQGLAHFLEHMAFKGSANVPEGEMIPTLQRLGLGFGADTNANTSWNETVFQFDLPKNDEESLATGIKLMRETASNLTLAQSAMDSERGVILSEERTRDTPDYEVAKARTDFMLQGQRAPTRFPIGQVGIIQNAKADALKSFYQAYYRPERATLVVTGDMDPAAMQTRIEAAFADWTATGPAGTDPPSGDIAKRGDQTRLIVQAGAESGVQLAWVRPPETGVNTEARVQRDMTRALGYAILNQRLQDLARGGSPPFIAAGAGSGNYLREAWVTSVSASVQPDQWKPALAAIDAEQRRILQFGVRQDEIDRAVSDWRASFQAAVASAATRSTAGLANQLIDAPDSEEVVTSPAQDLADFERIAKTFTPAGVLAALKDDFAGQGPLLFVTSPVAIDGGEQAIAAAYSTDRQTKLTAADASKVTAWPYDSFGLPGKVVDHTDAADLDADFVTFDNGVKLTVKPTKFANNQVQVLVSIGRGLEALPKDQTPMSWADGAVISGGLGKISEDDMERVLAGKVWSADFDIDDDAFELYGAATPADMETEMQVLAAYATDPGWRPEAFQREKTYALSIQDQMAATDAGVLQRDASGLMHPGDQRFAYPAKDAIAASTLDQLKAQIAPGLASGPIAVTIVGDITVDQAIDLTGATFGALPARPAAAVPPGQASTGYPDGGGPIVVRTHTGRADQATVFEAWKTGDYFSDIDRARAMTVLGEVVQLRLVDELRNREGATYSPGAGSSTSFVWPGWGQLAVSSEVTPDKAADVFAAIDKIAADLGANPPTADEMTRAKTPLLEDLDRERQTNGYWLSVLSGAQRDERRLASVRSVQAGLTRVTAADVQQAAKTYLTPANAWRMEVKPASAP